jgi:uncharacterized protein (DUF952 family)
MSKIFYHITTPEVWASFSDKDYCSAASLETEGFIHCSYPSELEETLALHFKGVEKVLLLEIDPSVLTSKLVVETSRGGLSFPHIYGVIKKSEITQVIERVL